MMNMHLKEVAVQFVLLHRTYAKPENHRMNDYQVSLHIHGQKEHPVQRIGQ